MEGYRSNNHVVYSRKYHVVWCAKYRRKALEAKIAKRCKQVLRKVAAQYKAEIMALEMRPDHVHMLVEIDPQWGIHRLVKNLKGVSSHDLRKEFASLRSRLPTLWTNRYFVSTVGSAPRSARKQYVENQKNV
jgi:putative transposase